MVVNTVCYYSFQQFARFVEKTNKTVCRWSVPSRLGNEGKFRHLSFLQELSYVQELIKYIFSSVEEDAQRECERLAKNFRLGLG